MLNSFTRGAAGLALALSFTASAASAETHVIMIMEGGYFPEISYVQPGDNLIFENMTEIAHVITGPDGAWTTESIPPQGTMPVSLNNGMGQTFTSTAADGAVLQGFFSYDAAPLSE